MPVLRSVIRGFAGVVAMLGLLGVAACAPTNPAPTGADTVRTQNLGYGVIVSMRPITVSGAIHANAVGAFGGPMAGGIEGPPTAAAIEFIVREDSGDTISVVQTNEANLRPGERVGLTGGPHTRVIRIAR
jgi:outer membrane lipoprotein SlyB